MTGLSFQSDEIKRLSSTVLQPIGLVLGKFAPFHVGHRSLIDAALLEMKTVLVVIYQATRTTRVHLSVRAQWIRSCYGHRVVVIEGHDGPEETGYSAEIMSLQEEYLGKLLSGISISAFYSGEAYGKHISKALNCIDRRVDRNNGSFKVSATDIRNNPEKYMSFALIPKEFIIPRYVFIGGPSTGKTTLADELGRRLNAPVTREYGREYWFENQINHRLSMEDLEIIVHRQIMDIDPPQIQLARDMVIHDTSPLTTYCYAQYYFGTASRILSDLVEAYYARDNLIHILCSDDIPFEDTPDRSGPGSRKELQDILLQEVKRRSIKYLEVTGNIEARVQSVLDYISNRSG